MTLGGVDTDSETTKHPSIARLYEAAASLAEPLSKPGELATKLGQSPAVITNWATRGVSLLGAYGAQRDLGINAVWVIDGTGPMFVGGHSSQPLRIDRGTLSRAIERVDAALAKRRVTIAPAARAELAVVLYHLWDGTLPSIERATSDALAVIAGAERRLTKDEPTS